MWHIISLSFIIVIYHCHLSLSLSFIIVVIIYNYHCHVWLSLSCIIILIIYQYQYHIISYTAAVSYYSQYDAPHAQARKRKGRKRLRQWKRLRLQWRCERQERVVDIMGKHQPWVYCVIYNGYINIYIYTHGFVYTYIYIYIIGRDIKGYNGM